MAEIPIERAPRAPRLLALAGAALALVAFLLLFAAGPGTRFGFWTFGTGFTLLRYAAYLGIAAAALSAGALATGGRRFLALGVAGLALGAATAYLPWSWRREARSYPPIHDVATDPSNPPPFVAVLPLRAHASNPPEHPGDEVAAVQREHYPELRPLMMAMPVDSAFRLAVAAAQGMPRWEIVDRNRREGRIEAVATTPWFGFRDDVVIRVTSHAGISRVDVRSKSRVGRGDAGANAARVRAYLERLAASDPAPVRAEE